MLAENSTVIAHSSSCAHAGSGSAEFWNGTRFYLRYRACHRAKRQIEPPGAPFQPRTPARAGLRCDAAATAVIPL